MTIVGSSAGAQAMVYRAQVAGAVEAPPDEPASSASWRAEDSSHRHAESSLRGWSGQFKASQQVPHVGGARILAFRKLYPAHFFTNFQFPMVEDIINAAPFNAFPAWLHDRQYDTDGPLGPHLADAHVRQTLRTAEGQQVGALNQRAALPPLLSYDLSPDEHFAQALDRGRDLLPTELPAVLDLQ